MKCADCGRKIRERRKALFLRSTGEHYCSPRCRSEAFYWYRQFYPAETLAGDGDCYGQEDRGPGAYYDSYATGTNGST